MSLDAKLAAALILVLALVGAAGGGFWFGNTYGTNAEKVKNQADTISRQNTTIKALRDADEENRKLAAQQAADAKQEAKRHADEIAEIKRRAAADAARRVPIDPAKFCPGHAAGSAQAGPAGSDGQIDTTAAFLPEPFAGDLRQLAADADEVAADLRTLKARAEKAGCFAGS